MAEANHMQIRGWKITGILFVALVVLTVGVFAWLGFNEAAVRLLVRDTARISATLFTLAFAASSLHVLFRQPWTGWLLQNRRYIGVSFAVSHFAHLLFLIALGIWFPHPFVEQSVMRPAVAGGVLAYVFIALMTATSFDRTAAMIGPRAWRILHTAGAYYIWIIFAQGYIPRAIHEPWYIPLAAMIVAGVGLRIAAWMAVRMKRQEKAYAT